MLTFINQFWKFFAGDLSPVESKAFFSAFLKVGWRLGLFMFIAFAFGAFSMLGIDGFARAGEMNKQLAPITAAQDAQGRLLTSISEQLRASEIRNAAAQIRLLVAKRCLEKSDSERERLNGEIYRISSSYRELDGYNPKCGDL